MLMYLDIETLPTNDAIVIAELHAKVAPPGNLKKAETIAAWWAEEGEKEKADIVARTSFDGMYGRICVISMAIDDEPPLTWSGNDEAGLIRDAFAWIDGISSVNVQFGTARNQVTFVGHNVVGFDLPFIRHRSIIHRIEPPTPLRLAFQAKPWGAEVSDTMLMWSSDREKRVSMDKLCRSLGIPGKDGFDGSMVAATWPEDPFKVVEYCMDDVERTRAIYKRLIWQ